MSLEAGGPGLAPARPSCLSLLLPPLAASTPLLGWGAVQTQSGEEALGTQGMGTGQIPPLCPAAALGSPSFYEAHFTQEKLRPRGRKGLKLWTVRLCPETLFCLLIL